MERPATYAFLDRCGNNWKNGRGGFGMLIQTEVSNTLSCIFQPIAFLSPTHTVKDSQLAEVCEWKDK